MTTAGEKRGLKEHDHGSGRAGGKSTEDQREIPVKPPPAPS
jgi:hypothetical protein